MHTGPLLERASLHAKSIVRCDHLLFEVASIAAFEIIILFHELNY